jgi:hypothetical protein
MSDGFLSRWSKLKRGEAPPEALPEPEPAPAPAPSAAEPEFDVASLPDIETVTAETDFTAFLQKGVPESLKRQALRRAWSLDPAIRDFCGPADYAWDFNAVDGVPGFSLTLGGDVAKLLAQAIGQLESWDDKPAAPTEAPSFLPPGALPAMAPALPEDPPEQPLRLAETVPEPAPLPPEPAAEPALVASRRHGGARPA